jgi:hypothetical protein
MQTSELQSLLERVEKATGRDRSLDANVAEAIAGWTCVRGDNWIGPTGRITIPEYTASLDAVLALVEEKYPRLALSFLRYPNGEWGIGSSGGDEAPLITPLEFPGAHLPIQVLAALLRALIAQQEEVKADG